ncbi:hypothetical protein G6F40_016942 [Rhizopus arrhizus]|nr:hypothetical protein G6F40_016942 [Rhizopus arrhizus]
MPAAPDDARPAAWRHAVRRPGSVPPVAATAVHRGSGNRAARYRCRPARGRPPDARHRSAPVHARSRLSARLRRAGLGSAPPWPADRRATPSGRVDPDRPGADR